MESVVDDDDDDVCIVHRAISSVHAAAIPDRASRQIRKRRRLSAAQSASSSGVKYTAGCENQYLSTDPIITTAYGHYVRHGLYVLQKSYDGVAGYELPAKLSSTSDLKENTMKLSTEKQQLSESRPSELWAKGTGYGNDSQIGKNWKIGTHMKSQAEKSRPQREFFHQILTDLRQEVKEFNRTAKSGSHLLPSEMLVDLCDDKRDVKNLAERPGINITPRNISIIKIDISNDDDNVEAPPSSDNDAVYILDDPPEVVSEGFVNPIITETDSNCTGIGVCEGKVTSLSNGDGGVAVTGDVILLDIDDDSDGNLADHQMTCDTSASTSSAIENIQMQRGEVLHLPNVSDSTTSDVHSHIDDHVGAAPIAIEGNSVSILDPSIPDEEEKVNDSIGAIGCGETTDPNPFDNLIPSYWDTTADESDPQLVSIIDQCAHEDVAEEIVEVVEIVEIVDNVEGCSGTSKHPSYKSVCIDLSEDASQGEGTLTFEKEASDETKALCDGTITVIGDCEELVVIEGSSSSSSSSASKRHASRKRNSSSTSSSSPAEHLISTPPEDESRIVLRCILQEIVEKSGLLRLLDTELRNESFLDIDNHSELYYLVYQAVHLFTDCKVLHPLLFLKLPGPGSKSISDLSENLRVRLQVYQHQAAKGAHVPATVCPIPAKVIPHGYRPHAMIPSKYGDDYDDSGDEDHNQYGSFWANQMTMKMLTKSQPVLLDMSIDVDHPTVLQPSSSTSTSISISSSNSNGHASRGPQSFSSSSSSISIYRSAMPSSYSEQNTNHIGVKRRPVPFFRPTTVLTQSPLNDPLPLEGGDCLIQYMNHIVQKVSNVAEERKQMEELQKTLPENIDENDGNDKNNKTGSTTSHNTLHTEDLNETRSIDESDAYCKSMRPLQYVEVEVLHAYKFSTELASANLRVFSKARIKRLAQEHTDLSQSLPLSVSSSVWVRASDRMDALQFMISGPEGTPYSNGLFLFDAFFPGGYPDIAPKVNLQTTGKGTVRFNPNLYNCGKVCLSLLGTWPGAAEEKWNASTSTFLQVVVSIQSLILVPDPYFNEPGYEGTMKTPQGKLASKKYNAKLRESTARWAMLEMLTCPIPGFEEVISAHFKLKRSCILTELSLWTRENNTPSMRDMLRKVSTILQEYD